MAWPARHKSHFILNEVASWQYKSKKQRIQESSKQDYVFGEAAIARVANSTARPVNPLAVDWSDSRHWWFSHQRRSYQRRRRAAILWLLIKKEGQDKSAFILQGASRTQTIINVFAQRVSDTKTETVLGSAEKLELDARQHHISYQTRLKSIAREGIASYGLGLKQPHPFCRRISKTTSFRSSSKKGQPHQSHPRSL